MSKQEYHYFANHAIGWSTGSTEAEAIDKLLLQNTQPSWVRNCLKAGEFVTIFSCRVPLPEKASYKIEWYIPQVKGITEPKNHIVTYLTKTKYAVARDLHDEIKHLNARYQELADVIRKHKSYHAPEVRAVLGGGEEDES